MEMLQRAVLLDADFAAGLWRRPQRECRDSAFWRQGLCKLIHWFCYACSVAGMLALMRQRMPQTHIVLEGLLPRADMGTDGTGADTPWPNNWAWPNNYSPVIAAVNLAYMVRHSRLLAVAACASHCKLL